jgi:putative membrane protein
MLAICAMILPGISGSFILLLLKKYEFITGAISDFNISVLGTFAAGAAVGITSFSHLLSWLFKRFHDATIAILSGFMIGSLNIVWPWKEVIETRLNSKGIEVPFRFESVLPNDFSGEPQMLPAFLLMILGIALILLLDRVTKKADI